PRAKLLQGDAWQQARSTVGEVLHRSLDAREEMVQWEHELDTLYRHLSTHLPEDVTITSVPDPETDKLHDEIALEALQAQEDPPSLPLLRDLVNRRLPTTDLSAIIREIEARTQLSTAFTHIGGSDTRLADFPLSLCAVLLSQACNLPITTVVAEGTPALSLD